MIRPSAAARPLLIGGMHRSGTSLTASLVASAGIDLGPELLGANASNPAGHFEDLGIQDFHTRCLLAHGVSGEGYTASAVGRVPAALEPLADDLLAERLERGAPWGWKEPRTTLFLDFWQERLPEARHLIVFRQPWEVADSLFRRGDEAFIRDPAFAFDVWTHYNRLFLDFVRRHRSLCAVFEISQVVHNPRGVFRAVQSRLGVPLGLPAQRYRPDLLRRDSGAARAAIVRAVAPEAWHTYLELRALAGLDTRLPDGPSPDGTPGPEAVLAWAQAARAAVTTRRLVAEKRAKRWRKAVAAVHGLPATLWTALRAVLGGPPAPAPADAAPDLLPFPTAAAAPAARRAA